MGKTIERTLTSEYNLVDILGKPISTLDICLLTPRYSRELTFGLVYGFTGQAKVRVVNLYNLYWFMDPAHKNNFTLYKYYSSRELVVVNNIDAFTHLVNHEIFQHTRLLHNSFKNKEELWKHLKES